MNNSKSNLLDTEHGDKVAEQMNLASMDCLPDDLLVQILYFLPTKEAISTSLLSKRWRTLYSLVHNLDLDDYIFWHHEDGYNQYFSNDIQKSFEEFMERTLALLGGGHIKTFSLISDEIYRFDHVVDSIRPWLYYNLQKDSLWQFGFPYKVFTSTKLVKLSLGTRLACPRIPQDTSLPVLKVLLLEYIWFEDNQLSDVFLAACPALEDLTIHHMFRPFLISSKNLKKLSVTINFSYYVDRSTILTLDTPNVVDLYYSDFPRPIAPHCHLDSLAKVELDLHSLEDDSRQVQNDADVKNLISEIRNVKTLHLTYSAVELMLSSKKRDWKVLPLLLERSPNLKTLVLSGLNRYTFGRRHRFVGIQIPSSNKIKMLSIKQYQGSATELKHISHLLLKMECLELVKVYLATEMDDLKKMQLTEDVVKLPAASSKIVEKLKAFGAKAVLERVSFLD
ncbi:putative protein [Arabidopsis thaliana]|uniref:Putative F-box/LRR-repeat protein At3g44090 n=1 Tax=Arabidopsis thaliana TaxID=3702 RepID=FBL51_ARATH|nr:F-box family protein [Arabidopsis thaliana]Q9LXQ3.1 RecName: Full=Putative F-box/LRR-repeat protein At3g44090 [Arabidopsis thaliana]AEE77860.1 F-box family protein [Arabidopsis thaliana]CAB88417.1 putative protein [Arabidopsis thaliana]|eukprot:NP_189995.1 F-box family protein [Arabidopsis thaliana]